MQRPQFSIRLLLLIITLIAMLAASFSALRTIARRQRADQLEEAAQNWYDEKEHNVNSKKSTNCDGADRNLDTMNL
jgi:hypothetical protein